MSLKENWPVYALLISVAVGLLLWFRTNAKKMVGMADFALASVKNVKLDGLTPTLTVGILINNPSDIAVTVKTFMVEMYVKNADGSRSLVTKSTPATIAIPKQNKVVNDVTFKFSVMEMVTLAKLAVNVVKYDVSALSGNLVFIVKADVLGQYVEKEFNY